MRNRSLILISAVVAVVLALVAAMALTRLPPGARLPVHWTAAGEANGFTSARFALFMPVGVTVGLSALFALLPRIEPMQDRMAESAPLLAAAWIGLLLVMALVEAAIAAPAFGIVLPAMVHLIGIGLLFLLTGNALPKSRPGFFVGIHAVDAHRS